MLTETDQMHHWANSEILSGFADTACTVCAKGLRNGTVSVRPSVCPSYRLLQQRAAGLLLRARRTGDIDRLLHGRRSAAAAPQQKRKGLHIMAVQQRTYGYLPSRGTSPATNDAGW